MDSVPENNMGNSGPNSGPIQHKELPLAKPLSRRLPHVLPMSKKVNARPLRDILGKGTLNNSLKKEMKRDERAGV